MPQFVVLYALHVKEAYIFIKNNPYRNTVGAIAFLTSMFSAIFGMSKFLKSGPCIIIPNEGPIGGFVTRSFILLFLDTGGMFFWKISSGIVIIDVSKPLQIVLSISLNFGIPFIHVSNFGKIFT